MALGAALAVNQLLGSAVQEQPVATAPVVAPGPKILVANQLLSSGTILGANSFRFQPWPEGLIENAYFIESDTNVAALIGTVVRHPITAGQPLTRGSMVHPDDRGFLAAALSPGMRAVTIQVSQDQGGAGFIFPGDRVDLLLTQQLSVRSDDYPDDDLFTSETIVRNIRVLATDQRYSAENETGTTPIETFGLVTLEATPSIAEKISGAKEMGQLSLSLRPLAEDSSELETAIASGEIDVPVGGNGASEDRMLAEIEQTPIDEPTLVSTSGGDISRYWLPVRDRADLARLTQSYEKIAEEPITPRGPVVRVVRGNAVAEVPVGDQ